MGGLFSVNKAVVAKGDKKVVKHQGIQEKKRIKRIRVDPTDADKAEDSKKLLKKKKIKKAPPQVTRAPSHPPFPGGSLHVHGAAFLQPTANRIAYRHTRA